MAGQMGLIGSIVGGAMGTVGGIFSSIAGMKADKQLSKLIKENPAYTSSPYAANNLGLSQQLLNSRMAGMSARERNIQTSGANARSGISRVTTDSSQAAAMMAGIQGQEGEQYNDLAMQEAQDAAMKQQNLMGANREMTAEHKDLFDDSVRRWQDQVNTTLTQYKMRQAGGQSFTNMGGSAQSSLSGLDSTNNFGFGTRQRGSDKRLKHNYYIVGKSGSGINIYEFSYIGHNTRWQGVMAQEVPQAAVMTNSGFYAVDYSKIDVPFKQIS